MSRVARFDNLPHELAQSVAQQLDATSLARFGAASMSAHAVAAPILAGRWTPRIMRLAQAALDLRKTYVPGTAETVGLGGGRTGKRWTAGPWTWLFREHRGADTRYAHYIAVRSDGDLQVRWDMKDHGARQKKYAIDYTVLFQGTPVMQGEQSVSWRRSMVPRRSYDYTRYRAVRAMYPPRPRTEAMTQVVREVRSIVAQARQMGLAGRVQADSANAF